MEDDYPPKKKIKREVLADFFNFVPSLEERSIAPFRIKIEQFLSRHAHELAISGRVAVASRRGRHGRSGMKMWYKDFRVGEPGDATSVVTLEVVEEDLELVRKLQKERIYCHHCSYIGREEITFPALPFCVIIINFS